MPLHRPSPAAPAAGRRLRWRARRRVGGALLVMLLLLDADDDRRRGRLGRASARARPSESDGVSALAQAEIPPRIPASLSAGGASATAWTGRSWRGSARSSATTGATPIRRARRRGRSTRRAPAGRCSSSPRLGDVRGGRRRRRRAGPLEPGRRDLRGGELPAAPRARRRLQEGDLRLQPRGLVRRRGRELGGEVSRPAHPASGCPAPEAARAAGTGAERSRERRKPDAGAVHRGRTRGARARGRPPGADPDGRAGDGAGDGGGGQRAAGTALRSGRSPGPAGGARRGLLEHRQLRAVPQRGAADRGNRRATTRWPRTTSTGAIPARGGG